MDAIATAKNITADRSTTPFNRIKAYQHSIDWDDDIDDVDDAYFAGLIAHRTIAASLYRVPHFYIQCQLAMLQELLPGWDISASNLNKYCHSVNKQP